MRGDDPAISVVIPCRNEAATLPACLDALEAQDFPPERFEVVLVDGGSTDGCRDIARASGIRVLEDLGHGPSAARNVGVLGARAPIVAFTDGDCAPERDWLTAIAEVFAEKPWITGVGGALRMPRRTFLGRMEDDDARVRYRGFITSNVAYRRDAILAVGGFDETLCCAEDYDLAWRLRDAGFEVVWDPRPLVLHDPPEIDGTLAGYLRKQRWYARNDVPAQARAWGRNRAVAPIRDALVPAAALLLAGGALLARKPMLLAGAAAALVARAWGRTEPAGVETAPRLALSLAKETARGVGTLEGLAALARGGFRGRSPLKSASLQAPYKESLFLTSGGFAP
ncbi:MAG: hypothetical protein QOE90_2489 [Thermoplasmata archaeon]|nr:hypothetical protein [Thermoplasmata archaeon]